MLKEDKETKKETLWEMRRSLFDNRPLFRDLHDFHQKRRLVLVK